MQRNGHTHQDSEYHTEHDTVLTISWIRTVLKWAYTSRFWILYRTWHHFDYSYSTYQYWHATKYPELVVAVGIVMSVFWHTWTIPHQMAHSTTLEACPHIPVTLTLVHPSTFGSWSGLATVAPTSFFFLVNSLLLPPLCILT